MTKVIESHPELDELLKEFKTETVAEEALRILELIPENKWCVNQFVNSKGQSCAVGHYLKYKNGFVDSRGDMAGRDWCPLRAKSMEFIGYGDISSVNNNRWGDYNQGTPKQRVIALLQDMIKAGY